MRVAARSRDEPRRRGHRPRLRAGAGGRRPANRARERAARDDHALHRARRRANRSRRTASAYRQGAGRRPDPRPALARQRQGVRARPAATARWAASQITEADEVEVADTGHGHRLHDHHAGAVLRPERDRAVRVRVGVARRRRRPISAARTSSASHIDGVPGRACGVQAVWKPTEERSADGVSNRLGRCRIRDRARASRRASPTGPAPARVVRGAHLLTTRTHWTSPSSPSSQTDVAPQLREG